jgi:hypothetical protein
VNIDKNKEKMFQIMDELIAKGVGINLSAQIALAIVQEKQEAVPAQPCPTGEHEYNCGMITGKTTGCTCRIFPANVQCSSPQPEPKDEKFIQVPREILQKWFDTLEFEPLMTFVREALGVKEKESK